MFEGLPFLLIQGTALPNPSWIYINPNINPIYQRSDILLIPLSQTIVYWANCSMRWLRDNWPLLWVLYKDCNICRSEFQRQHRWPTKSNISVMFADLATIIIIPISITFNICYTDSRLTTTFESKSPRLMTFSTNTWLARVVSGPERRVAKFKLFSTECSLHFY